MTDAPASAPDSQSNAPDELAADGLDPIAAAEAAPPAPACPNCGSTNIAAFCADCGQNQESPRKRWREHVEEIASTYTELDSATLKTVATVVRRPGALTEAFLENRAGDYVTPLKLFLIFVVLYSILFALSPIKYGQFYIATEREWDPEFAENYEPGEWGHSILMYAPEVEDSFSPGFRAALEAGVIDAAALPAWVAEAAANEDEMREVRDWSAALMVYLPLCIIPVFIAVNGFLFRKRYLLIDHFFLAFETAALLIIIIMATEAVTAGLYFAGIAMGEATPYFLIELPLVLLMLTAKIRRFYRVGGWRAFGTAFLILFTFMAAETIIYYPGIEIIARLV